MGILKRIITFAPTPLFRPLCSEMFTESITSKYYKPSKLLLFWGETLKITNVLRSYMATGFQTYKLINNWCNCEQVSVALFSCNQWQGRERQILILPIHTSWNVAIFKILRTTFNKGIILATLVTRSWRIMAFYFQKLVKVLALSYPNYFFLN